MAKAIPYHVLDGYSFVAYPNRDSTPFRDFYKIPEAHTIIRGALRYEGNPVLVKALADLGWLDSSGKAWLQDGLAWAELQQRITGADSPAEPELIKKIDELCTFTSPTERAEVIAGLQWIGLFSNTAASIRQSLLDTLSAQLERLCSFQPGERDLVILQHKFVVEWKDGSQVSFMMIFSQTPLQQKLTLHNRKPSHLPLSSLVTQRATLLCRKLSASPVASLRRCFLMDALL
jgi:saccharopine dehydrogenase (NADP+, L-glutamate forming)